MKIIFLYYIIIYRSELYKKEKRIIIESRISFFLFNIFKVIKINLTDVLMKIKNKCF